MSACINSKSGALPSRSPSPVMGAVLSTDDKVLRDGIVVALARQGEPAPIIFKLVRALGWKIKVRRVQQICQAAGVVMQRTGGVRRTPAPDVVVKALVAHFATLNAMSVGFRRVREVLGATFPQWSFSERRVRSVWRDLNPQAAAMRTRNAFGRLVRTGHVHAPHYGYLWQVPVCALEPVPCLLSFALLICVCWWCSRT
jgi:hypothetical protein